MAVSVSKLVEDELWIPYSSVGLESGAVLLLDLGVDERRVRCDPIAESTLASYFEFNPGGECGLVEMWRVEREGCIFRGGGGDYEGDGFVASFGEDALDWIVFLTDVGPLRFLSVTDGEVLVETETPRVTLAIDRAHPWRILQRAE